MTPKPPKKGQNPPKLGIFGVKSGDFGFEMGKNGKNDGNKKSDLGSWCGNGGDGEFWGGKGENDDFGLNCPEIWVKNEDFG